MMAKNEVRTAAAQGVVSAEEWLELRRTLLKKEKELTKAKEQLVAERRKLPWVKIDQEYSFHDVDGSTTTLSDLFGEHKDLLVVHFMFDPEWKKGCKSCSFWADGYDGQRQHILQRANMVVVAKAPHEKLKDFKESKGWKFPFLSSYNSSFNADFGVGFTTEQVGSDELLYNQKTTPAHVTETPGWTVFRKEEDGSIYKTYSVFARGLDVLNACYQWIDLLPEGRINETHPDTMSWMKHKEEY